MHFGAFLRPVPTADANNNDADEEGPNQCNNEIKPPGGVPHNLDCRLRT